MFKENRSSVIDPSQFLDSTTRAVNQHFILTTRKIILITPHLKVVQRKVKKISQGFNQIRFTSSSGNESMNS